MNNGISKQNGFVLIDALVGVLLITLLFVTFISSIHQASLSSGLARDKLSASIAALEVYEVAVHIADEYFSDLQSNLFTCSTGCHFENDGTTWFIHSGGEFVTDGRFERIFTLAGVNRDTNDDIVTTGGVIDGNTLELTITVDWNSHGTNYSDTIATYLYNN